MGLVDRGEFSYGFELQDNRVLDQHVEPLAGIQPNPLIDDRERKLGLGLQSAGFEIVNETDPVRAFQEARTEHGVILPRAADDPPRHSHQWFPD